MLSLVPSTIIPQAHAACDPSKEGIDLGDCLTLGAGEDTSVSDIYKTPADVINPVVTAIFAISGIVLFAMIIQAGFKFISAGTKGKDEAKSIVTTAIGGLVIMFVAYWIVKILEIVSGQTLISF